MLLPCGAIAQQSVPESARPAIQADDPVNVDTPVFPDDVRIRDAFRLRVESHFVPSTNFPELESTLYRPNLRGRITIPVTRRAVLELTPRWETSRYEFAGDPDLYLSNGGVEVLHTVSLSLQGAFALDIERKFFSQNERWSVLGGVRWGSTWEGGAFSEGMGEAGTVAVGYETDSLRLAIGVGVSSRLTGSGARVLPVASIRWSPLERLTLRNRGQGLQIEYRLSDRLEVFTSGYVMTRSFRLHDRSAVGSAAVELQDKQVLAGVGFEWKVSHALRLNVEGGVVAWSRIRVRDDDDRTLGSFRGDPTGYVAVAFELRP